MGDFIGGVIAGVATLGAIGLGGYYWVTKIRERSQTRTGDLSVSITYQSQANYWTADLVKGQIVGGNPLTAYQASIHVASGNSIMCRNQMAAQYLIFVNGYVNAVGPERHRGGYWHYHPTRNHTGYSSIHIWYFN